MPANFPWDQKICSSHSALRICRRNWAFQNKKWGHGDYELRLPVTELESQWTGSECFCINQSIVSQKLSVLTHMWSKATLFVSIGTLVRAQNCLISPKHIRWIRAEKPSWTSWRLSKSVWFANTVLAFCCSFREHDAFTWFNYFLTKSLALNPARRGTGSVWPANLKHLPSHVIVLQKPPWKKSYSLFQGIREETWPWLAHKR